MKHFYARMTGKLLGDGTITKEEGKSPRFHFTHQATDKGWFDYCYQQLKPYLPLNPPVYRKVKDHRLTKGYSENYFVRSRVHPLTTKLRKIWYPNDTKIIPFSFIEKYLTEKALSWWYQDDGHLKIENNKVTKLILSTDSFTNINYSFKEIDKIASYYTIAIKSFTSSSSSNAGCNRLCNEK